MPDRSVAADLIVRDAAELVTLRGEAGRPRIGSELRQLGIVERGALAAPLYADGYLSGQSSRCPGKVKLSHEELHRITLWLDLNSNELGACHDVEAQKEGKPVRPELD